MSRKSMKVPRPIGRPPAGAREGERVKDYPQVSIRLPADAKAKLQALSLATTRPQWRIVTEAIDCYLHLRPAAERGIVGTLLGRPRGRAPRARRAR
jgi:predicted transcriptional regulator